MPNSLLLMLYQLTSTFASDQIHVIFLTVGYITLHPWVLMPTKNYTWCISPKQQDWFLLKISVFKQPIFQSKIFINVFGRWYKNSLVAVTFCWSKSRRSEADPTLNSKKLLTKLYDSHLSSVTHQSLQDILKVYPSVKNMYFWCLFILASV